MRPCASTRAATEDKLEIMLTSDNKLWLCNFGGDDIQCGPAELFGYNLGSFQEKPRG